MAMNKQRRTSNINNVVTYDTSSNVTVPAGLTQGFVSLSLLKADVNGKIIAATSGADFQSPITLTTTGSSGAATLIGSTLNIPQYTAGSGTINYVTKWATSSTLGNSLTYDNGTSVSIGTSSPLAVNKLQVEGRVASNVSETSVNSSIYSVVGSSSVSYAPSSSLSGSVVLNGVQGGLDYTFGGNLTIPNSVPSGAVISVTGYRFTGTGTVTQVQAGSGTRAISNIYSLPIFQGSVSGTISHIANIRCSAFYTSSGATLTVNNFYGLIIEQSDYFGINIVNKWGIYQEGSSDNNYFSGKVLIGTNTVGSSKLKISGLPTSSSGLTSGDVWNDGGTLKIV